MRGGDEAEDDVLLYTPAHPLSTGDNATFALEPWKLQNGDVAVIAFSSVPKLVKQLGTSQPWIGCGVEQLQTLAHVNGLEQIVVDPTVYPLAMRWAPAHLENLWSRADVG